MLLSELAKHANLLLGHWLTIGETAELIARGGTIPGHVGKTQMACAIKAMVRVAVATNANLHWCWTSGCAGHFRCLCAEGYE